MIRYSLKCTKEHSFESWFQSAAAYETLRASGHLSCPECGTTDVEKSIMAPRVSTARKKAAISVPAAPAETGPLSTPQNESEAAIARMKSEVEAKSEYVGMQFANEARAMHEGESEHRAIWGEAKPEEAKSLIEDGVPVLPLPFTPTRKTN